MEADLQLMFANATAFNEPGSQIYKDARYTTTSHCTTVLTVVGWIDWLIDYHLLYLQWWDWLIDYYLSTYSAGIDWWTLPATILTVVGLIDRHYQLPTAVVGLIGFLQ